jgi:ferritin-like metal-binding protein YciE
MKMKTMHDLFVHSLQDLYSAENQIIKALPKMIKSVTNETLKAAFEEHLKQTDKQIARLEEIKDELGIQLDGKFCKGMEGLLAEGEEILKEDMEPAVRDAALIEAAQKVEHYEIAGYGTVVTYAGLMAHENAEKLLKETLNEEEMTDKKLSDIAESEVNMEMEDI